MKRIYLVRHAKSSWKDPDLVDFDRPLNKRGKCDAPFMGKRLRDQGIKPDLLVASPAKRAWKTAGILAREMNYQPDKIVPLLPVYSADIPELLSIISGREDKYGSIMLVGHNPAITELAEHLSGEIVGNIPTCGIFCLDFGVSSWKDVRPQNGRKVFFDFPKKHLT